MTKLICCNLRGLEVRGALCDVESRAGCRVRKGWDGGRRERKVPSTKREGVLTVPYLFTLPYLATLVYTWLETLDS